MLQLGVLLSLYAVVVRVGGVTISVKNTGATRIVRIEMAR
jgi:hypothetical protein